MGVSANLKSRHDFEPYGVELEPIGNDTRNFNYKFTGQERDTFTNYDYMHFRFYASSIGRFLTPDNIIPDVFNPQSWNLYSYVNGNPVNFNDPLGLGEEEMPKPYYFTNVGSTSWLNCDTYCAFMSGLYGGNVTFGAGGVYGGGGTQSSGYWQPIYGTIVTTSGEPVWNEELQAWVGLEVTVTWGIVGYQYVEIKSGGGIGSGGNINANGYLDVNFSFGTYLFVGITMGMQLNKKTEEFHPYLGFGVMRPGCSASITASENSLTEGWNTGLQVTVWPFFTWQWGVAGGEYFYEKGLGFPPGGSITNYYVLPAIKLEPANPEVYKPANRKFFSPW